MDPDIEQGLQSLRDLRAHLGQWLQDGPYEKTSERIGGVTAEANLAEGVTDLEIDHYWQQSADVTEIASCTVQAVNAAEEACRARLWEGLQGMNIGTFSWNELADPDRRKKVLQDPTSFFESFTSGLNDNDNRRESRQ